MKTPEIKIEIVFDKKTQKRFLEMLDKTTKAIDKLQKSYENFISSIKVENDLKDLPKLNCLNKGGK